MTSESATLSKLSDIGQTVTPSGEDIRGRTVKDKDGKGLGTVHDLLVDNQEHKVRFLLVEHGGFLGLGQTKSFIRVDAITEITADEVFINHTREHVAGAPPYDPDIVDEMAYPAGIYDYYGYTPYWGAGYVSPLYPGRII